MRSKVILEEIPELKLPEKYNKNVNILNNSPVEDGGHSYKQRALRDCIPLPANYVTYHT